jgi:TetR/AcrR family transcriptional regulator
MNTNSLIEHTFNKDKPGLSLSRRERDKLLRKADILKAAEQVFALKGFHNATVQDIARQAQYATGTVYLYFADKDALYFSIVEEKIKDLFFTVRDKTQNTADAREKLEVLIRENLEFFARDQYFFRIFATEGTKWSVKSRFAKSSVAQRYKEFVVELVKTAQAQKVLRADFEPNRTAEALLSLLTVIIFDWLKEGQAEKNLGDVAVFILEMFLNGAGKK